MPDRAWTPKEVAEGGLSLIPDAELPNLAARWLAEGYESEVLLEVAFMSRREGPEARQLFGDTLASLGYTISTYDSPWDELPWRGYWDRIAWAVSRMDQDRHSPYASAQVVVEVLDDVPDLWEPGGGDHLVALLASWDTDPTSRATVNDAIRAHLRRLAATDVPPLQVDPS